MIKRETIEGRPATVAYVTDDMVPVDRDKATLIKIIFDDGEVRFGVKAERDRLKSQFASAKRRSMALLQKYDGQPRDHGKFDFGKQPGDDDKGGGGMDGEHGKIYTGGANAKKSDFKLADGKHVAFEGNAFSRHADNPKAASALMQYEYGVGVDDLYAKVPGAREQVAAARAKVAKADDTQKLYKNVPTGRKNAKGKEIFRYDPQRVAVHKAVADELMPQAKIDAARVKPGERPTLYILGGRGGSGKGWFTKKGGTLFSKKDKAVYINNDDVKEKLPEYQGWNAGKLHEEASDIGEDMEKFARDNKLNTIIDMTMKSDSSLYDRIEAFKAAGYKISGHYMYASPATAAQRALERFIGGNEENDMGRFVPPEYSLQESITNENTFDNNSGKMDYWEIYDNMGEYPAPPKLFARKDG